MQNISILKEKIKAVIVDKLSPIEGLTSITFVGSFESSMDLSLISDIDIVVIVNELSVSIFDEIQNAASSIKGVDLGLDDYSVKLNMAFGPLKFNDNKTVVFHIMVYDVVGHRKHVLESPFTCLDWEFYPAIYGKNLSEIYPASGVQLDDLASSRRGLMSYLDDLKKNVITYRAYDFSTVPHTEKKNDFQIDDRHKKEYAYHVLKFLQLNLLKVLFQNNVRYTIAELTENFSSLNPSFKAHAELLFELHKWKYENAKEPSEIFKRLEAFILDLSIWLNGLSLIELSFIRHGRTGLNDGSFLGVRRNPSVDIPINIKCEEEFDEVYTGTLRRSIETAMFLKYDKIFQNELLNEIDYGLAEGLTYSDLDVIYPELIKSWLNYEDPTFPEGECQMDVSRRLQKFLKNGLFKKRTAIVTHNVVLRTLIGNIYKQPVYNWYKLNINHLEIQNVYYHQRVLIPNFSKEQQKKYKDEIVGFKWPITKYGVFWIPNEELKLYVEFWKNKFREVEPDAIFLEHPVHTTIFLFNGFEHDQSEIISCVNNVKLNFLVGSWKIFENDPVTKGDTFSIGLVPNAFAFDFQRELAESLLKFIKKPIFYNNLWEGTYKVSHESYGFPFVGSHWIPHLTIASAKKEGKKLINELKTTTIKLHQKESSGNLALFKINGDSHQLIHTWQ